MGASELYFEQGQIHSATFAANHNQGYIRITPPVDFCPDELELIEISDELKELSQRALSASGTLLYFSLPFEQRKLPSMDSESTARGIAKSLLLLADATHEDGFKAFVDQVL